ncbi:hypothetical protein BSU04_03835 [Caballeronia sordidicola]|uniref:Uncharacterized protein n=1 Tax=Caballeronia sordidicola TaxID=196367 RepID=A0A226X8W3_CABSO|nr:hypothetical protein BSU04_03835 [Caballeronia sordidicola]
MFVVALVISAAFCCFLLFPLRIFKALCLLSTRPDNQYLSDPRLFVCITHA